MYSWHLESQRLFDVNGFTGKSFCGVPLAQGELAVDVIRRPQRMTSPASSPPHSLAVRESPVTHASVP